MHDRDSMEVTVVVRRKSLLSRVAVKHSGKICLLRGDLIAAIGRVTCFYGF